MLSQPPTAHPSVYLLLVERTCEWALEVSKNKGLRGLQGLQEKGLQSRSMTARLFIM